MWAHQHVQAIYVNVRTEDEQLSSESAIAASYIQHSHARWKKLRDVLCQDGNTASVDEAAVEPAEKAHRRFIPRTLRKKLDNTV